MAEGLMSVAWDLRRVRRGGQGLVAEWQRARLADLLARARSGSPYYRELYRDLPDRIDDVTSLPVTTKAELMSRYDDWATDRAVSLDEVRTFVADTNRIGTLYRDRYQVVTTSGTSGHRGVFVQDDRTYTVLSAITVARAGGSWLSGRDYLSMLRRGNKVAAIWAVGGHFAGYSTAQRLIRERPIRKRSIRVFSVHTSLDELVRGVGAFGPTILNGYATAVSLLAREQRAGRLGIRPVLVITSAEGLSPEERAGIRESFQAKVRDQYACSEFMGLAHGCEHDWLHVNADWAILEPVDEGFRAVPPGKASRTVLLTNLANRVQPIIRYDLGDSVTIRPGPCPCGNPLPAVRVQGRTSEVISFPGPDGRTVDLPPLALGTLVDGTVGVRMFQIVQTDPRRLAVRLITEDGADTAWEQVQQALRGLLDNHGLADVRVDREAQPPQRTAGGKFRTVFSELPRTQR
ncbi:phenylacetate--CoA ligase family protein [Plantactinospora sp. S1510]|uniref:Phenylacetate--CoA ligase family protein n=1 Tax=Plantactinospora alkalitolerans TaxID=2789879 RepID=A0ABS0GRQ3_9ACTN|nr:phenylacetate--CoA ligase family protein [Plantactinospora alkalitolerans]MBF9128577.1 phenylacetate--CoA ligase family protein [Plantactinospora alkalitolerans]